MLLAVLLSACKQSEAKPQPQPAAPDGSAADPWNGKTVAPADGPCARLPFAESIEIAEASAAVLLPEGLMIVSDSGNGGRYVVVDADTGAAKSKGVLPLGVGASDDLEGLAVAPDGALWGVTSSGYLRKWTRDGDGWALVDGPYALGHHLVCKAEDVNCGANLEGLCLAPKTGEDDTCVGFVASKADGHLHCLQWKGERLHSESKLSIAITDPNALADCTFDPEGKAVWTGGNAFDGGLVSKVTGWRDMDPTVTTLGSLGVGFPEVVVVGPGDVVYRLSDTGTAPSLSGKWNCGAR